MRPSSTSLARRRFLARVSALAAGLALPWRPRLLDGSEQRTAAYDGYLGEIMLLACNFPPRGWALCNGQLLPINQNMALFQLLGTTYGGNGQTNFALPNLQGRVVMHQGQGPGLSPRPLGMAAGSPSHTLTLAEIPAHTHLARCSTATGTLVVPSPTALPARNAAYPQWAASADTTLAAAGITAAGSSQPHENQQPYLVLNYVIALVGVWPSP